MGDELMQLFDPARPKIGDRLAYITPAGKPAGTIPPWIFYPRTDGRVYLSIYLMVQPNNARQYEWQLSPAIFSTEYLAWLDDPEEWYQSRLGWQWEEIPPPSAKNKFSLADIGL